MNWYSQTAPVSSSFDGPSAWQEEEERSYAQWLKGHKAGLDKQCAKDLVCGWAWGWSLVIYAMDAQKPLRKYWTDPSLDQGEAFLRDYILNKGYLEKKTQRCVGVCVRWQVDTISVLLGYRHIKKWLEKIAVMMVMVMMKMVMMML